MENESRRRVAVCGGGAAGLLCAYFSAKNGDDVTVFEKNHAPARKLAITGKGRCNVTNDSEFQEILQNIPRNPKFLYAALRAFSPEDTKSLFESFGVALKTERGNRVFPVSDNAYDIVDALVGACKKEKVKILCDTPISHLWLENGSLCGVKAASKQIPFDKVVIATGGKSYPLTGSTGDGYLLAKEAGHTIIPPSPALIPIETEESWPKAAMGLSLKNTALEVTDIKSGKKIFGDFGEMLFTHFGISGPMVLSASSYIDFSDCKRYKISIDLKPALDENTLDMRIRSDFEKNINKDFQNSLDELLPSKLIPVIVSLSKIVPHKKVNSITKEERADLVYLLKHLTLTPKRPRPIEEAIITRGGVETTQIDPKNMQSKLTKGLFFAGEVIDVDAKTGGFNLQIAFSTAYLASQS